MHCYLKHDSIFSHHNKQHKHFFNPFVYFRSVRCGQRVFAKPQFDCKPRAAKLCKRQRFRLAFGSVAPETGRCRTQYSGFYLLIFQVFPVGIKIVVNINPAQICIPMLKIPKAQPLYSTPKLPAGVYTVNAYFAAVRVNAGNKYYSPIP